MNRYNKYIFLNSILYFIYCEIKHFFRFFKYFLHRKKDFNVISNTTAKCVLKKNYLAKHIYFTELITNLKIN